jgi:hypothetical protein
MASIRLTRWNGACHQLVLFLGWFCCLGDSQRVSPCPGAPGYDGYLAVKDITLDIGDEIERIKKGGAPLPRYEYVICPQAKLLFNNSDFPIAPAFDETYFSCGEGDSGTRCEIHGGDTQFIISEKNLVSKSGMPKKMTVSFKGIAFAGFSKSAIAVTGAEEVISVSVHDCQFAVRCFDARNYPWEPVVSRYLFTTGFSKYHGDKYGKP